MRIIFLNFAILIGAISSPFLSSAQDEIPISTAEISQDGGSHGTTSGGDPDLAEEDDASSTDVDMEPSATGGRPGPVLSLQGLDLEALVEGDDPISVHSAAPGDSPA